MEVKEVDLYSPEEIDELKDHLYQKALELKNKELPERCLHSLYRCLSMPN